MESVDYAMDLFMNARQRNNDDMTAYGNALENLWCQAYPNQADRSVSESNSLVD